MPMRGWNGDHAQYEKARVEAIHRYWASKRSVERRKKQSELAKTLNKTMPQSVRKANGKKISEKAKERYKDPAARAQWVEALRRGHKTIHSNPDIEAKTMVGMKKRRKDLDRAREIVNEWGLYVEDNATQAELDEIIAIFM